MVHAANPRPAHVFLIFPPLDFLQTSQRENILCTAYFEKKMHLLFLDIARYFSTRIKKRQKRKYAYLLSESNILLVSMEQYFFCHDKLQSCLCESYPDFILQIYKCIYLLPPALPLTPPRHQTLDPLGLPQPPSDTRPGTPDPLGATSGGATEARTVTKWRVGILLECFSCVMILQSQLQFHYYYKK